MNWREAGTLGVDYPVEPEQRRFAYGFVKKNNVGHRGEFDGDMRRQYVGILGQTIIADLYGLPRPIGDSGDDGGEDFFIGGKVVDVKTTERSVRFRPHWFIPLKDSQVNWGRTDVYLMASMILRGEATEFTVLGWIKKIELDRKWFRREGETDTRDDGSTFTFLTDTWQIPGRSLHPWTGPDGFANDMTMFG